MSAQSGSVLFQRRYRPFWLMGVVVLALAAYAVYWFGRLAEFKAVVEALVNGQGPVQVSAEDISYSGFPYRLSAEFQNVTVKRAGPDYALTVKSSKLTIERQPWRSKLHLGFFETPTLTLTAPTVLDGVALEGTGSEGRFSLMLKNGHVERLSTVLDDARISGSPWLQTPLTAAKLELHGREVAALRRPQNPNDILAAEEARKAAAEGDADVSKAGDSSPTPPAFLELIVNGAQVQLGQGEPLTLMASLAVTGEPRAADTGASFVEAWREAGGTLEVNTLTLSTAAKDDLVLAKGTFALDRQHRLMAGGTVTTPCPAVIAGLFGQNLEQLPEGRVQGLISLPFQALSGKFTLQQPLTEWPSPARNRDARCPDLRR